MDDEVFKQLREDEKLRRDNVQNKTQANKTHFDVGRKVRETIYELGGTMPEDLPSPQKSIKQLISTEKKKLNK